MNAPLDWLHVECLAARSQLRGEFAGLSERVAVWEPLPCPGVVLSVRSPVGDGPRVFGDDPLLNNSAR